MKIAAFVTGFFAGVVVSTLYLVDNMDDETFKRWMNGGVGDYEL